MFPTYIVMAGNNVCVSAYVCMSLLGRHMPVCDLCNPDSEIIKLHFRLNSPEHEIYPVHKCKNANNCWHFNIYKQEHKFYKQDKYNI